MIEQVEAGRWCVPRLAEAEHALVPIAVHLDQFMPLLVDRFGDDWWRHGGIALRSVSTIISGEPVRCYLEAGAGPLHRLWMNAEGEELIVEGTAGLGSDGPDEMPISMPAADTERRCRLLAGAEPGATTDRLGMRVSAAEVDKRIATLTEPMACYRTPDASGVRVVPPGSLVGAMNAVEAKLAGTDEAAERLPGALLLRYVNGPVVCDRDYQLEGRVLAVACTEREETLCYQAELSDVDGTPVARLVRLEYFGTGAPLAKSAPG